MNALIKEQFESLLKEITIAIEKRGDQLTYGETEAIYQKTVVYIKNLFRDSELDLKTYLTKLDKINDTYKLETSNRLSYVKILVDTILIDIDQRLLIESAKKKSQSPDATIIHHDDEGKPLTVKELIIAFDASERTNRQTGRVLSETSQLFEQSKQQVSDWNSKYYNQAKEVEKLKSQVSTLATENRKLEARSTPSIENKKSVSYWPTLPILITFFTYLNFTAHLLLNVQFNWIVSAVAEILLLAVFSIFFFREKAERRNIVGAIIGSIVFAALTFLAIHFANILDK
jgi:hypothetical protein